MARRIRYSELETRASRDRLKPGKAHWRALDPGKLSLGYRRMKKAAPGVWLKRVYAGTDERGIGHYQQVPLGVADDFSDADGINVLSFGQAQMRARDVVRPAGQALTVRDALAAYFGFLQSAGKDTSDAEIRANVYILPKLGHVPVEKLTAQQIRKWLAEVAAAPAMFRAKQDGSRITRPVPIDDEAIRRRRSSANRVLTTLKAALNHCFDEGLVAENTAWGRRVKPFKAVDVARLRYLSMDEAQRLINAADPNFRPLVRAALETGCRYGGLIRLQVADFNADAGTITIRQSKTERPRHVVLTDHGVSFFAELCAGRPGHELMFGPTWRKSTQTRPMDEAVARAKIKPPISFHGLRHTWASLAVMAGMPLMVVARNLGHVDTRMVEKHYGHLAPSFVTDAIRSHAPKFGKVTPGVVSLPGRRK